MNTVLTLLSINADKKFNFNGFYVKPGSDHILKTGPDPTSFKKPDPDPTKTPGFRSETRPRASFSYVR